MEVKRKEKRTLHPSDKDLVIVNSARVEQERVSVHEAAKMILFFFIHPNNLPRIRILFCF